MLRGARLQVMKDAHALGEPAFRVLGIVLDQGAGSRSRGSSP
jgi:hypothetical protein